MKISKNKTEDLKKQSLIARKEIIKILSKTGLGHAGSIFSEIDILLALYSGVLKVDSKKPNDPERDKFILSKGHGALGLYYVLMLKGFIPRKDFNNFIKEGTELACHPVYGSAPGIEATTGSLGHGLSIGLGLAIAARADKKKSKTYVLLSDGECDEGSTWEAILLAGHLGIDNLVVIVDYNKIQSFGKVKEILDLEPFVDKWIAAKWAVKEIDGHNFEEILNATSTIPNIKGKPSVIIAHTIKGKGIPHIENTLASHYESIQKEQLDEILESIN